MPGKNKAALGRRRHYQVSCGEGLVTDFRERRWSEELLGF